MPNIKSAKKRVLVNATKQARNKSNNSALTIRPPLDKETSFTILLVIALVKSF